MRRRCTERRTTNLTSKLRGTPQEVWMCSVVIVNTAIVQQRMRRRRTKRGTANFSSKLGRHTG